MNLEAIQYLPVDKLVVEPQVRKKVNREVVVGIAKTIATVGLMTPIRVRRVGERLPVIDGHLRLLAAKLAGLKSVPVIIEERELSENQIVERQLIANCRRENLRPLEFAEAIEQLIEGTQSTASEIAERLGESLATISRHRALLTLPEEIRLQIDSGEISASAAYKLTHARDAAQQAALAVELSTGQLTRDGLIDKLKAKPRSAKAAKPRTATTRVTAALSLGRTITFAGPGLTNMATLVQWLEELLAKAKSETLNSELPAFVANLKQQSKQQGSHCES